MVTLLDTSAWVEHDRQTESAVDLRLTDLLERPERVGVTEAVRMEVLAAARSDRREAELSALMETCRLLPPHPDFDEAARVYRRCRRAGVTPRGLVDCLIAVVGLRHLATLLAQDVDLVRVADVMGLRLDDATPRPA